MSDATPDTAGGRKSELEQEKIRRKKDLDIAKTAFPYIVDELRKKTDNLAISKHLVKTYGINDIKAYKWVSIIEEGYLKKYKGIVYGGAGLLFSGTLLLIISLIFLLIGAEAGLQITLFGLKMRTLLAILGVLIAAAGVYPTFFAKKIVFRDEKEFG